MQYLDQMEILEEVVNLFNHFSWLKNGVKISVKAKMIVHIPNHYLFFLLGVMQWAADLTASHSYGQTCVKPDLQLEKLTE